MVLFWSIVSGLSLCVQACLAALGLITYVSTVAVKQRCLENPFGCKLRITKTANYYHYLKLLFLTSTNSATFIFLTSTDSATFIFCTQPAMLSYWSVLWIQSLIQFSLLLYKLAVSLSEGYFYLIIFLKVTQIIWSNLSNRATYGL